MRRRLVAFLLAVLWAAGCSHPVEEVVISPEPVGRDLGLGPGVQPLSFGPGDKGSPRWSPSGEEVAFVIDGYVVDKPVESRDVRRRTTTDFGARMIEWLPGGEELAILGRSLSPRASTRGGAAYRTLSGEEPLGVAGISRGVLTMEARPDGEGLILAVSDGDSGSKVVLTGREGKVEKTYRQSIEGRITGLSASPDGESAVLAVRSAGERSGFGLYGFDLARGGFEEIASLEGGIEVIGAPQWTSHGIYYVAGRGNPDDDSPALYDLYHLPEGAEKPALLSSVGEDFVASSLRVSPDRERLAVVGRRNPTSPGNLYVLDMRTGRLEALTANENMEIKTGPADLAWSPGGESIAIIARSVLSPDPEVYAAPADSLLREFYNVYEVPVVEGGG